MVTNRHINDHFFTQFGQPEWQKDSTVVPDWMNAARGSESYARVAKLIDEIRQVEIGMNRAMQENWYVSTASQKQPKAVIDQLNELERRHSWISETLSRYSYSPTITRVVFGKLWILSMSSTLAPDEYALHRVVDQRKNRGSEAQLLVGFCEEHHIGEADVVLRILNLAATSELDRVKQCERCSKWLFAERSHQRFCPGGECRLAEYSKSPKYKNYRKLYMRRQRAKQADQESGKLPRRKGK